MPISIEQLNLFKALFSGRTDTYARRWEKEGKSGYSPAYNFNWTEFNRFRATGGKLKDFENKTLLPITDEVLLKHLTGDLVVGIYPLLENNMSSFIVADFDNGNWKQEALQFVNNCANIGINAYLEISRSGKGCHAWIFFEQPISASQSRKVILSLIDKISGKSDFDKEPSFDRLFPNQDSVYKNGFGNLIALPLQGGLIPEEKTVFVDPISWQIYEDQWNFLNTIKKTNADKFLNFDSAISLTGDLYIKDTYQNGYDVAPTEKILVTLENMIVLKKNQLSKNLVSFIKDELNFSNLEYQIKQKVGKSVYNLQRYFRCVEEKDGNVFIPRGFLFKLLNYLEENNILYELVDNRPVLDKTISDDHIALTPHQLVPFAQTKLHDYGVIVSPPGSGKTVLGIKIIADKDVPALIIVHRKQLLDQWLDRIESFLGIPKKEIGQIHGAKKKFGDFITVATIQSLAKLNVDNDTKNKFGTIIVDECHHIPARIFRETIVKFNPRYLYGLTATPKRKFNDEKMIFTYIGDVLSVTNNDAITSLTNAKDTGLFIKNKPEVYVTDTTINLPFKYNVNNFELLSKVIVFDTARNALIVFFVNKEIEQNRKCLILTERTEHIEILNLYLGKKCEVITICGTDSVSAKKLKMAQIKSGNFNVIISTGQFFGEGIDINNLDTLLLVYPFSFENKLVQYLGRIQRSFGVKRVYDFRDKNIEYLERLFKERLSYYKKNCNVIENNNLGLF